jgi:hypothetical protein
MIYGVSDSIAMRRWHSNLGCDLLGFDDYCTELLKLNLLWVNVSGLLSSFEKIHSYKICQGLQFGYGNEFLLISFSLGTSSVRICVLTKLLIMPKVMYMVTKLL